MDSTHLSKRQNSAERNAIIELMNDIGSESFAVITPYVNQRNLLRNNRYNNLINSDYFYPAGNVTPPDNVMTIHASQGREWDTVILSVVDANDKWFTDSENKISNGKFVLNTAVSRAKEKLIIVCDYEYWKNQKKQFIGKLLEISQPYYK
jgi:superfamily I DNA and/or RNA helicase